MEQEARQYRTRLEVLREILAVGSRESNKTRLIRLANLNPTSFDRYIGFCLEAGLLEARDGRYRTTPSGQSVSIAIDNVIAKAEELGTAVQHLRSAARGSLDGEGSESLAVRFASAVAWAELTTSEHPTAPMKLEVRGRS